MEQTGIGGANRAFWDYVSPFESYDYVSRWYAKVHGEKADIAKVREINAAFAQGRMYFENARAASMGVKPVLLYYGVLSLCTGLVLCRDREKTERTLAHLHGLSRCGWEELLATGIGNVLALKIRGEKRGTHTSLGFSREIRGNRISFLMCGISERSALRRTIPV